MNAWQLLRIVSVLTPAIIWIAASWASTWLHMLLAFSVAGGLNAIAQPAANVMMGEELDSQSLGRAMGIKQSAAPLASIFAGVTGPTAGAVLTWRWILGLPGLVLAGLWLAFGRTRVAHEPTTPSTGSGNRPQHRWSIAAASMLGAAASSILSPFLVVSVVRSGLSIEFAAIALVVGGIATVIARLSLGQLVDRSQAPPITVAAAALGLGSAGIAVMANAQSQGWWIVAVILAFGAGWGWPGVLHVSMAGASSPGLNTGTMQAGTYVGGVFGGVGFGFLADVFSFSVAWSASAITALISATFFLTIGERLRIGARGQICDV